MPQPDMDRDIEAMVAANLGLADDVAGGLWKATPSMRASYTYDDVLSEAHLGLVSACRTFDVDRGFKFSSFAWTVIRNQVLKLIRVPIPAPVEESVVDRPVYPPQPPDPPLRASELRLIISRLSARGKLNNGDRMMLRRRHGVGAPCYVVSTQELAKMLGKSTREVGHRLSVLAAKIKRESRK